MHTQFNDFLVSIDSKIREVVSFFNEVGFPICLVVNKQKHLLGIITDGDLRRYISKNVDLEASVETMMYKSPIVTKWQDISSAQLVMKERMITALPIINEKEEVVGLLFSDGKAYYDKTPLPFQVVINAGGKGTRLYPYTKVLPKPLIPVGDKTILEHIITRFTHQGCSEFISIVNHKRGIIKAYFQDLEVDYSLSFVDESTPLGTGGGLSLLKGFITQPFFFTNCDIIIDADYRAITQEHLNRKNSVTMVCAKKNVSIPYGVVNINEDNQLTSFSEKPNFDFFTNTGFYVVSPEVLEIIPEGKNISFPEIMDLCKNEGMRVGVYSIIDKAWLDMGQIDELDKMIEMLGSTTLND